MPAFVILAIAMAALAGMVLLRVGLRGRRVGEEPRCGKCLYNLTGLISDVCPECGTDLLPEKIVHGMRRRRKGVIVTGVFLLCFAIFVVGLQRTQWAKQFDKYQLYPFSWVLADAQARVLRGANELERRCRSGSLSDGQANRLAEAALKEQGAAKANRLTRTWIEIAENLFSSNRMTPAQRERFLMQLQLLHLGVRPKVRLGEEIPFRLSYEGRGSSLVQRDGRVTILKISIDARNERHGGEGSYGWSSFGGTGWVKGGIPATRIEVGHHRLECVVEIQVFDALPIAGEREDPAWRHTFLLAKEFEVVPANAPDTVTILDDPSLTRKIKDAVSIENDTLRLMNTQARTRDLPNNPYADITIVLCGPNAKRSSFPISVAFEVFLRTGQGEFPLGEFVANKGVRNHYRGLGDTVPPFDDKRVAIILRSSPETARKTIDVFEVWKGEIVIENVKVEREAKEPDTNPPDAE